MLSTKVWFNEKMKAIFNGFQRNRPDAVPCAININDITINNGLMSFCLIWIEITGYFKIIVKHLVGCETLKIIINK